MVKNLSAEEESEGCAGKDPDEAQSDEDEREEQAVDGKRACSVSLDAWEDIGQLETDEEEDQAVQDEVERLPRGEDLDARRRAEIGCAATAEEEAAGDDADHARTR